MEMGIWFSVIEGVKRTRTRTGMWIGCIGVRRLFELVWKMKMTVRMVKLISKVLVMSVSIGRGRRWKGMEKIPSHYVSLNVIEENARYTIGDASCLPSRRNSKRRRFHQR
jgi:hypothetical protein